MKRLMIRISALVCVVVLGLIAIAQAQREADPAGGAPTADSGGNAAGEAREPQSAVRTSVASTSDQAAAAPGLLPASMPANPLRQEYAPAEPRAADPADAQGPSYRIGARQASQPASASSTPDADPFANIPIPSGPPPEPLVLAAGEADGAASGYQPAPTGDYRPPVSPNDVSASASDSGAGEAMVSGPASANPASSRPITPVESGTSPGPTPAESAQPSYGPVSAAVEPKAATPSVGSSFGSPAVAGSANPGEAQLVDPRSPVDAGGFDNAAATSPGRMNAVPLSPPPRQLGPRESTGYAGASGSAPEAFSGSGARALPRMSSPGPSPATLTPDPGATGLSQEGTGRPGSQQLEGPQLPQVTMQKIAPPEVQVGKPATFEIRVQNTGKVPAHGVEIHDTVPRGTRLIGTTPRASAGLEGTLVWVLGNLEPGETSSVQVELMPTAEGEIGSVASVRLSAEASARTVATKPELRLEVAAPPEVLIGEEATMTITVSNPGTGKATGVVLEATIPPTLEHDLGADLDCPIGQLQPNQSQTITLKLRAVKPGQAVNRFSVRADANLRVEHEAALEVVSPQLDLALEGPKRRFLERQATYTIAVSNPGTAPAKMVRLAAQLPEGLKFVDANNAGYYEATTRTVHWTLAELPPNRKGEVELVAMPVEAGEHVLTYQGTAERGLSVQKRQTILVEGIAAIMFTVVDLDDPVELGSETTYEIRVVNQGSKNSTNVRLDVTVPPAMRPVAAEGPAPHAVNGQTVSYQAMPRLAPKQEVTYRVRVQGLQSGDQRVRVQLMTDEMRSPVTKEESTRVYADE